MTVPLASKSVRSGEPSAITLNAARVLSSLSLRVRDGEPSAAV
jgi:hypothetical protein